MTNNKNGKKNNMNWFSISDTQIPWEVKKLYKYIDSSNWTINKRMQIKLQIGSLFVT